MTNNNKYKEFLDLCNGAHNKKDIAGWQTLQEFNKSSTNKDFDARVYKQGNRIVISFAGSTSINDYLNDSAIFSGKIPSQYGDAERLYKQVKAKYPYAQIETTGYSLGGTLANLLSHRIGIKSTALAPIGSKHIVNKNKNYFTYDDSNITIYGRNGDYLFQYNINRQSGNTYIIPNIPKDNSKEYAAQHLLHNYNPYDIYQAKPYKNHSTGQAAPIQNDSQKPYTPDGIGKMSQEEFNKNENVIMEQLKNGKITNQAHQIDYSNYKNPQSGKNRVFTKEDIDNMSTSEFSKYENEIMTQMNSIGIPNKNDLPKNTTTHEKEKSNYKSSNSDGEWVTINGNHVLIEK